MSQSVFCQLTPSVVGENTVNSLRSRISVSDVVQTQCLFLKGVEPMISLANIALVKQNMTVMDCDDETILEISVEVGAVPGLR